jgi:hypothetical protein
MREGISVSAGQASFLLCNNPRFIMSNKIKANGMANLANFHQTTKTLSGAKYVIREKRKTTGKKKNDSPTSIIRL